MIAADPSPKRCTKETAKPGRSGESRPIRFVNPGLLDLSDEKILSRFREVHRAADADTDEAADTVPVGRE
jgi:hypothetical protein